MVLSCAASAEDAEVVELPRGPAKASGTQTFAALSAAPKPASALLNYECRRPAASAGENAGFRVEVSAEYRLKIYTEQMTEAGKRSGWALFFEQAADRDVVNELLKWMEHKRLDAFDARRAAE